VSIGTEQVRHASLVILHPDIQVGNLYPDAEPTDLALIRLDSPVSVGNSTTGQSYGFYQGDTSKLGGQECWFFGYGWGTGSEPPGVLRYGFLGIGNTLLADTTRTNSHFVTRPTVDLSTGETVYPRQGDSGGRAYCRTAPSPGS
jgi:hypothetical protein